MLRISGLLFCCFAAFHAPAQMHRIQVAQPKMGSLFNLIIYTEDSAKGAALAATAYALVDSLNLIFSDYDPRSELNYLNSTTGSDRFIPVSTPLYHLVKQSLEASRKSRGAFDITMGPVNWLWRQSRKAKQVPPGSALKAATAKTGYQKIVLDTVNRRVKLLQKGMQLDLGGIAKGYTAQAVVRFLSDNGITTSMLDAGGDIACSGAPPGKKGWAIGINLPEQADDLLNKILILQNGSVATSGDVYQYTEHNGKRYSHIIDPRTGYGVTFQRNVTVIAGDGATADWLATACSIVPIRRAKKLVRQYNAALLIGVLKGNRVRFYKSGSLSRYLQQAE